MTDNLYPNTFQIHNFYVDKYLSLLDGNEIKILLYAIRKILGFQKRQDSISLSQFENATGLNRVTVVRALGELKKYGLLVEIQASKNNPTLGNAYFLQFETHQVDVKGLQARSDSKNTANQQRSQKIKNTINKNQSLENSTSLSNELVHSINQYNEYTSTSNKPASSLSDKPVTSLSNKHTKPIRRREEEKEKIYKKEKEEVFDEQPAAVVLPPSNFSNSVSSEKTSGQVQAETKQAQPKSKKTKSLEIKFPEPFMVTKEMQAWFKTNCPLVDLKFETEQLKDWALSKGVKKIDWIATWRTWMRRVQKDLASKTSMPTNRFPEKPSGMANVDTKGETIRKLKEQEEKYNKPEDRLTPEEMRQMLDEHNKKLAEVKRARELKEKALKQKSLPKISLTEQEVTAEEIFG